MSKLRITVLSIIVIISITIMGLFAYENTFSKQYAEYSRLNPITGYGTTTKKEKVKYKVKKAVYDANFTPPATRSEQVSSSLKNSLVGVKYLGTLRTMNQHLNLNIYDGVSNQILNTGNAGAYPNFNFDSGNSAIAAHTYAQINWNYYDGLTMIQKELNKGDKVYATNGDGKYYEYSVMDKTVIPAKNGAYITETDRWKDKNVNPSGKPMLTMYDCYENNAATILEPSDRNVVLLTVDHEYDKSNVPSDIKKLFSNVPNYHYDNKTKTVTVKENKVKPDGKMKIYKFLFETIKIQKVMKVFMDVTNKI